MGEVITVSTEEQIDWVSTVSGSGPAYVFRFIEAMERIHAEITAIINGTADKEDNVLKNSPHTAEMVSADEWRHPYSRSEAAYPVSGLLIHKFWPYVGRVDNVYGDRNLVCTCDTVEEFSKAVEL